MAWLLRYRNVANERAMKAHFKSCIGAVLVGVCWLFVGVERIVGDHEVGVSWEPFLKHRPSLTVRFTKLAQKDLEIVPFEALSPKEQADLMEFCRIRFGFSDYKRCYISISNRNI